MTATPRIVVVGSHGPGLFIHVKRMPVAGETVSGWGLESPIDGGKGSNQAVAAARLGVKVSLVSCFGIDQLGEDSLRWLAEANVDTSYVKRSPTSATLGGFVILDQTATPSIIVLPGAAVDMTIEDVSQALSHLLPADVLITQFEIPVDIALYAARLAHQRGTLCIINPSPVPETMLPPLDMADVLVPNETEALALLGLNPTESIDPVILAETLWQKMRAGCVMVTLGERGVVYAGPEGPWQIRPPVVTAVDTTGAGDAFCGALAVGLGSGLSKREAAQRACMAAAYSVTKQGTIPIFPTTTQLAAFISEQSENC